MEDLLRRYGHPFGVKDAQLYRVAFRHRSSSNSGADTKGDRNNERLEFLGDAVLNLTVARYLYERYPDQNEDFMSRMRCKLVNGAMLADLCRATGLHEFVVISRQTEDMGGRQSRKVMEDAFEAFLGAMFVDAGRVDVGFETCYNWIITFLEHNVDMATLVRGHVNQRDTLARYFRARFGSTPTYVVDHLRYGASETQYVMSVRAPDGEVVGRGTARHKRAAEDAAAADALSYYTHRDDRFFSTMNA